MTDAYLLSSYSARIAPMTNAGSSKGMYSELCSVNNCLEFEDSSSHSACPRATSS